MDKSFIRQLILLDGLGALVSAFMLGIVLVKFESYIGIPKSTLYILAAIPCFFAVYDFICYFIIRKKLSGFLKVIAYMNLLYCALSLALALSHSDTITLLGWAYIVIEIIIVIALALYELRVANRSTDIRS